MDKTANMSRGESPSKIHIKATVTTTVVSGVASRDGRLNIELLYCARPQLEGAFSSLSKVRVASVHVERQGKQVIVGTLSSRSHGSLYSGLLCEAVTTRCVPAIVLE